MIMYQRRIYEYFPSDRNRKAALSGLSFLDLPYGVRRSIYVLAGLVRRCTIDFNYQGINKDEYRWRCGRRCRLSPSETKISSDLSIGHRCEYDAHGFIGAYVGANDEGIECICAPLPYQLFYVSRAVSDEVLSILYSENRFQICWQKPQGLSALLHLSAKTLGSLTSLVIRLNDCSWKDGICCHVCSRGGGLGQLYHLDYCKVLAKVSREDKSIMEEWRRVGNRINAHIQRNRLELCFICDTANIETAKQAMQPFMEMPPLRECAIRLGLEPEQELQHLAETTVRRVTGRLTERLDTVFPFSDLPGEIQQQILSHTDLIAPRDIGCGPHSREIPHPCCERCTEHLPIDFCPIRHAAFASKCSCWKMPKPIFEVSRTVREMAIRIFYSRNEFTVPAHAPSYAFENEGSAHRVTLEFLEPLLPNALKHIRYLRFYFPRLGSNYLSPGETATSDWLSTVDFLARNTDLSRLSLVIDMSIERYSNYYAYRMPGQVAEHERAMRVAYQRVLEPGQVAEHERAMWVAYQRVLEPMVRLSRLKNLYVYLSSRFNDSGLCVRDQREQILEKRVMGDDYDSLSCGKTARTFQRDS